MKTLGIVLALALLSGCSGGTSDSDGGSSAPKEDTTATTAPPEPATVVDSLPATAEPVWSKRFEAIDQPVAAGDVLVAAVAARGDEIDVVALDRADGAILWRKPLMVVDGSVGAYLGDLVYESAAGKKYVVMQQAGTGGGLRAKAALPYQAIEPRTGKVVARTRPVVAQFGAPACDDGLDVCLRISADDEFKDTRWVLDSWKLRPQDDGFPVGGNPLAPGSDVYTVAGTVGRYNAIQTVGRPGPSGWRVSQAKITGSKRWVVTSSEGYVDKLADVGVVQMFQLSDDAANRRYGQGKVVRLDLAGRRTAGLDLKTGRVLWRHKGADVGCLDLTRTDEVPVRCSYTGKLSLKQSREPKVESARAWIEGYDPNTGETTWQQELSPAGVRTLSLDIAVEDAEVSAALDDGDLVILPTRDGQQLVSLIDGSARPLENGEAVLCVATTQYKHRFDTEGSGIFSFAQPRERIVAAPCTPAGKKLGPAAMKRLGPNALVTGAVDLEDGMRAVATRGTIEVYQLS